jgi:hypothetical protein
VLFSKSSLSTPIIPATQQTETRRSWFKASLGKNSARPCLKNRLDIILPACHFSYSGIECRKILIPRLAQTKTTRSYLKNIIK